MGAGHDDAAGAAVVAVRECPADVDQRSRGALVGLQPFDETLGGVAPARRHESGDHEGDDDTLRRFIVLVRFALADHRTGREALCRINLHLGGRRLVLLRLGGEDCALGLSQVLVVVVVIDVGRLHCDALAGHTLVVGDGRCRVQVRVEHLAHHEVRVGAAEAKSGHAGHGVPGVARPVRGFVVDLEVGGLELDVRVGAGVVQRRREFVVGQREHDLGQCSRASGGLHVPEVRLRRAQKCGLVRLAALAEDSTERIGLDRVTEDRAGAVRLDVVDVARIERRIGVGGAQHLDLRLRVGRRQAVGPAVGVDRRTGYDGQHLVAVASCVGHPLEDEHAAALGSDHAVRVRREGLDVPVLGDRPDGVEADRGRRCEDHVDPTGHSGVRFA